MHPDTLIALSEDKNIIGLKQAVDFRIGEKYHEDTVRVIKETKNNDFTVLSGETGAGKSILIGALSFLLGGKADVQQIRAGKKEASVSGTFLLPSDPYL